MQIDIIKKMFDADLKILRHDKFNLEVRTIITLRFCTVSRTISAIANKYGNYSDGNFLKEFEKRENNLTEGVAIKIAE